MIADGARMICIHSVISVEIVEAWFLAYPLIVGIRPNEKADGNLIQR